MRFAIEAVGFAAVLFFLGAADSLLASEQSTKTSPASPPDQCLKVQEQAIAAMHQWQTRWQHDGSEMGKDAAKWPRLAYYKDQEDAKASFSEKYLRRCRLDQHGIVSSYEP